MWSDVKFPGYECLKETVNFAIIHDPSKDPFDKTKSNYYLVYKPHKTLETDSDSFAVMLMYLSQAEAALKSNTTDEDNIGNLVEPIIVNH